MPKDEWAKANSKDAARRSKRPDEYRRHSSSKKKNRDSRAEEMTRRRLSSLGTRFWFGKHKGRTVAEVLRIDRPYLVWFSRYVVKSGSFKMHTFAEFIGSVLSGTQCKV